MAAQVNGSGEAPRNILSFLFPGRSSWPDVAGSQLPSSGPWQAEEHHRRWRELAVLVAYREARPSGASSGGVNLQDGGRLRSAGGRASSSRASMQDRGGVSLRIKQ